MARQDIEPKISDPRRRYDNDRKEVSVENRFMPIFEARLATNLIEKWGMVAAMPDGEDSSGRQKARMMDPSEIVHRACETARLAADAFYAADWMVEIPSQADLNSKPESAE